MKLEGGIPLSRLDRATGARGWPFVGTFIAKISRGRTLRQFVAVVVVVPSIVALLWFAIFGTTAIDQQRNGAQLPESPPERVLFTMLEGLPLSEITTVIAALLVAVFFITGADSASLVMGTLSQQGRPEPARWITVVWGSLVGAIAAVLLVAGGEGGAGLSSLQNVTIIAALPFAVIMALIVVAFTKDLRRDPLILRDQYAERVVRSVRNGLEESGDDFALLPAAYDHSQDDLAWVEHDADDALSASCTAAATETVPKVPNDTCSASLQDVGVGAPAVEGATLTPREQRDRSQKTGRRRPRSAQ